VSSAFSCSFPQFNKQLRLPRKVDPHIQFFMHHGPEVARRAMVARFSAGGLYTKMCLLRKELRAKCIQVRGLFTL